MKLFYAQILTILLTFLLVTPVLALQVLPSTPSTEGVTSKYFDPPPPPTTLSPSPTESSIPLELPTEEDLEELVERGRNEVSDLLDELGINPESTGGCSPSAVSSDNAEFADETEKEGSSTILDEPTDNEGGGEDNLSADDISGGGGGAVPVGETKIAELTEADRQIALKECFLDATISTIKRNIQGNIFSSVTNTFNEGLMASPCSERMKIYLFLKQPKLLKTI